MPLDRTIQFIEQEHVIERAPQVFVMANNAAAALADQEKIERKGGIRLTNVMKESILGKVYDFKFQKSGDQLDAKELRLGHKAMVAMYGQTALDQLAKIGPPYAFAAHDPEGNELPPEQLAAWKGEKVTWRVGALGYQIALYIKDPLPQTSNYYRKFFVVKAGKLADDIVAWQADVTEWIKQKREMQLRVNAVLNSVTTFKSLQNTWPDGERFYKHVPIDFPFRNQVPAVKVDELNAALGL